MREPSAELVRINDKGEAHPIGVIASQRMRAREGAFRVMPTPGHVVFMRYTGEDGRRDAEDGAIVKLAGEITAPAALCDVLAMMVHTRWRGELMVLGGGEQRSIFMENGNIVGAQTTAEHEKLGRVLFRFGAIDEAQHDEVLQAKKKGHETRYGETAVALGFVSEEQLYHYVGKQIEEIVFGGLEVDDGTFFFLDGFDADRLASHHIIGTNMLLMDAVTRMDEIKYFRNKIPSADWVPVLNELRGDPPEELRAIYDAIDGKRSIAAIGRITGFGEFETTKAVFALAQSKHVAVHPPRVLGGARAMVDAANTALRTIHQTVEESGKGAQFREALADFAAGAGGYEVLFHGAGPDEHGQLDAERVAQNARGDDEESFLKNKLHEYVSFAIFAAGSLLGSDVETQLSHATKDILAQLQPSG